MPASQSPQRLSQNSSQSPVRQPSQSPPRSPSRKSRSTLRRRTSFAEELQSFANNGNVEPKWGVLGAPQTVSFRRAVYGEARKLDKATTVWIAGKVASKKKSAPGEKGAHEFDAVDSARFLWRKYIQIVLMAVKIVRQKELVTAEEARKLFECTEEPQDANVDPVNAAVHYEPRPPSEKAPREARGRPSGPRKLQQMQQIGADDRRIARDLAKSADIAGSFSQAFAALQKQSSTHKDSLVEINSEIEAALAMSKILCKCMGIHPAPPPSQHKERLPDVLASLQSMDQTLDRAREELVKSKQEPMPCLDSESESDSAIDSEILAFFKDGIDAANTSAAHSHKQMHPEEESLVLQTANPLVRKRLRWLLELELSKKAQGALGVDAGAAASDEMLPALEAGAETQQDSPPSWFSALELAAKVANSSDGSIEDGTVAAFEKALLSACDEIDASGTDRQLLLQEVRRAIFGGATSPVRGNSGFMDSGFLQSSKDDLIQSPCLAGNDTDHEVSALSRCRHTESHSASYHPVCSSVNSDSPTNMQRIERRGDVLHDGDTGGPSAPQLVGAIIGSKSTEELLLASELMVEHEQNWKPALELAAEAEIDLEKKLVVRTPKHASEVPPAAVQLDGNASETRLHLKLDKGRVVNAVLAGLATVVAARLSKLETLHLPIVSFPFALESLPARRERRHTDIRKGFVLATEARARQREQQDMTGQVDPVAASVTGSSEAHESLHRNSTPTPSIQSVAVSAPTQKSTQTNVVRRHRLSTRTQRLIPAMASESVMELLEARGQTLIGSTTDRSSRSPTRRLSAPSPVDSLISTSASESAVSHFESNEFGSPHFRRRSEPVHSREASRSPQRLRVPAGSAVEVIRQSKRRLSEDLSENNSLIIEPTASWSRSTHRNPSLRSASPAKSIASDGSSSQSYTSLKIASSVHLAPAEEWSSPASYRQPSLPVTAAKLERNVTADVQ